MKVYAVSEELWRLVNRLYKSLHLSKVLEGVRRFVEEFDGVIISEAMIIDGIVYNGEFERIESLLGELKKSKRSLYRCAGEGRHLKNRSSWLGERL
ncbi:MAG: hypothetical protein QXZ27_02830 [Candidatus Bathyarchaeia archaeon]